MCYISKEFEQYGKFLNKKELNSNSAEYFMNFKNHQGETGAKNLDD